MNRLWVWLSTAFALVVALAAGLVLGNVVLLRQAAQRDQTAVYQALAQDLGAAYLRDGGWSGAVAGLALAYDLRPADGPTRRFILRDRDGRTLYRSPELGPAPATGADEGAAILDLPVDAGAGEVGRLTVMAAPAQPGIGAADRLVRDLALLVLLGSLLGVVASLALARWVTAPLERLAAAARELAGGRRGLRVAEAGSREVRAAARAFNDMAGALEHEEQLRRNMVADAAHELRTPLTVLQGTLQGILDGVFPLERTEIERVLRRTETLTGLVEDLRELAQAEAGSLRLTPVPTDPAALVRDLVEELRPMALAKGVALLADPAEGLPILNLDRNRMAQVLRNLLSNALRHTPAGGTVTLSAGRVTGTDRLTGGTPSGRRQIAFAVADTGEGISVADLPHVFDRFFRADRSRRRDSGGAGLGLAIARAIVEAHGGRLSVESAGLPGEGACFTALVEELTTESASMSKLDVSS